jgi:hypothetical protein
MGRTFATGTGEARGSSISFVALRCCRDESAARAAATMKSLEKPRKKKLQKTDFVRGARCAFVETNAQRPTYG